MNFPLTEKDIRKGEADFLSYEETLSMQCGEEEDGYVCTRTLGHEGRHAAHVNPRFQAATWLKEEK